MRILRIVILFIVTVASFSFSAEACRFTVREIAYSILSQTKFTFVIIDKQQSPESAVIRELSAYDKLSNVNVVVLNESEDGAHPFVELATSKGLDFPAYFILAPNNDILSLHEGSTLKSAELKSLFHQQVLNSPVRDELLTNCHASFARVLLLESDDEAMNHQAAEVITENCRQINDLIPMMPKEIRIPPTILRVPRSTVTDEKVFLWSLGLDSLTAEPRAVVLYGRGRLMGRPIGYQQILEGLTYKYMTLIGADCECGIDRKWMLGRQALLKWDATASQQLATEVGFDVDSPSILAEMSRIIAKEVEEENVNTISFGPENIDVDHAFGLNRQEEEAAEEPSHFYVALFASLGCLFLLILLISFIVWKRAKR